MLPFLTDWIEQICPIGCCECAVQLCACLVTWADDYDSAGFVVAGRIIPGVTFVQGAVPNASHVIAGKGMAIATQTAEPREANMARKYHGIFGLIMCTTENRAGCSK